jgi:hypothetical protein
MCKCKKGNGWPGRSEDDEGGQLVFIAVVPRPKLVVLILVARDENGTDIFQPYSSPNPFRGGSDLFVSESNIQHPIPYLSGT